MKRARHVKEIEVVENQEDLSTFPELATAISSLREQLEESSEERQGVITNWINQLEKINKQMRHLERLESFSDALKKQDDTESDEAWGDNI